jgi:acyl-ACP thioesterase
MFPNTKEFLTKEFRVNSYFTDLKGNLSIPALFELFQEVAWEHATLNHFGYEDLLKQGYFWALSRVQIQIHRIPKWTEQFNLTTWPSGTEGLFALRDYQMYNSEGEVLIGATSSWLIVDIKTRRPQRLEAFKGVMPIRADIRATNGNATKIDVTDIGMTSSISESAKISDIDVNGHINNTKYVEWAINSFPINEYKNFEVKGIEVNFLSEGFCGDSFSIIKHQAANQFTIFVNGEQNGKKNAIVRVK